MISNQHDPTNRLPTTGAGFVWDTSGAHPVLRPVTDAADAWYSTRLSGNLRDNRDPSWSFVEQVHGREVVTPGAGPVEADGLHTDDPSRTLAVFSADCVLLLMSGPGGLAVVHAGWRGLVAGVIENAVRTVGATEVFAGPAIGPCCFEVGAEVTQAFADRYPDAVVDGRHVDLWTAAQAASGAATFHAARLCTSCHPGLFFSHRRDRGATGRQALIARITGAR